MRIISFVSLAILMIIANATSNCSSNQYLNSSSNCSLCSDALDNCTSCVDNTNCTTCSSNYIVNATFQCQSCSTFMPNCSTCTSETSCTTCEDSTLGVKTSVSPNICQLCNITLQYCISCSNTTSCQTCVNNPEIHLKVSGLCVYCNETFQDCITCSSSKCTLCINSTTITLFNGSCVPCGVPLLNCRYCQTALKCNGCVNSLFALTYVNGSKVCKLCAELMSGCIICPNSTYCSICSVGVIVKNGCSPVAGCIEVIQIGIKNAVCVKCSTVQFLQTPQNGVCKCISGYVTGSICTPLRGCKETNILNSSLCKICSKNEHFNLTNTGTCACISTFYHKGDTCQQICGDGLLFTYQCDDGNLIDGDGCSSTCQIQQSYYCVFGSPYSSSKCIFNQTIYLSLDSIYKISNQNSMSITFSINPKTKLIERLNLTKQVNFSSIPHCSLASVSFTGQKLVLLVDYFETIKEGTANVSLSFDPQYIISSTASVLNFQLADSNQQDLYYSQNSTDQSILVEKLCKYISILALLLLVVGSFAHKMIGIQTIHSIQLIFLIQIVSPNFRSSFFNFRGLLLSLGRSPSQFSNQITKSNLNHYLQYYGKYSQSYIMVGIAQLIGIVILLVLYIKELNEKIELQKDKTKTEKDNNNTLVFSVKQIFVHSYFYPIFLGFIFQFKLLLLNSLYNRSATSKIQISALMVYCIVNYIVFLTYFKNSLLALTNNKNEDNNNYCSVKYITNYLIFIVVVIGLIQIQFIFPNSYFSYLLGITILVKIISIVVICPYKKIIHNLSILFNYAVILFNLTWTKLQQLKIVNNQTIPYEYILSLMIIIIQVLCLVRIVIEFRSRYGNISNQTVKTKQRKVEKDIKPLYFDNLDVNLTDKMHKKLAFQISNNFNIITFKSKTAKEDQQLNRKRKGYREMFEKQRLKKSLIKNDP